MVLSMERWKGKVAVVTGASAGIGAAIVKGLVENGVLVVGMARSNSKLDDLAKSLKEKPGKCYSYQGDVTKEEDILKLFEWTTNNVGPVYILINSAGVARNTNLIDGDAEKWKEVFDINVLGLCIATREAVSIMKSNNIDGHIIHLNSIAGHRILNVPSMNVYPASKHAVTALTETLRQELNSIGSKIKITSISPGAVQTEFREAAGLSANKYTTEVFDKMPHLEAKDVADAVLYALSTPPHVQVHEVMMTALMK